MIAQGVKKAADNATIATAAATQFPASPKRKAREELDADNKKRKTAAGPWCTWCRKNGHHASTCSAKADFEKSLREEGKEE
ncbi:hypothetical protein F52700_33 [Fusarium sp. NRRL 52700]|nr:hypothetical protein F52700_33 [Fusarium sp. NRRL 52700]